MCHLVGVWLFSKFGLKTSTIWTASPSRVVGVICMGTLLDASLILVQLPAEWPIIYHIKYHTGKKKVCNLAFATTRSFTNIMGVTGGYSSSLNGMPTPPNPHPHRTHRYTCRQLLLALWTLLLSVGSAVLWRLLVGSTAAALRLPVSRPLLDDVEQVKRALVLPVWALGLTSLVAVLAGGVVPPAQLYAGAQTLHDGVVQLWHRRASGGGHHRPVPDPTGNSS